MALSDDQKAMLRLLAQREQGYDDIAALMGLSVDEVRAQGRRTRSPSSRRKGAGAGRSPTSRLRLTPSPRRAAVEPPAGARAARRAATPEPPPRSRLPPRRPAGQSARPPPRPKLSLPGERRRPRRDRRWRRGARPPGRDPRPRRRRRLRRLAAATPATTTAGRRKHRHQPPANPKLTQAVLDAVDGSDAKGVATFGRVKNTLALQIEAEGLEPTGKGESYTIWLAESPQKMLPLAATAVGEDGKIGAQVEVPTEVLGYLANETFDQIVVTRTDNAALKASLEKATAEKEAPTYTGAEVLGGDRHRPDRRRRRKRSAAQAGE